MKNDLLVNAGRAVKYWWVSVLIGILAIIVGIWCLATPDTTLVALSIVFMVSFLVGGIFEIIFAVSNRDNISGWGFALAGGIIDLLFGILLVALPLGLTATFLIYFVGFWIMFRSIWGIGTAIDFKKAGGNDWGWLVAFAVLGVIFAFAFILSPAFGAGVIIALVSFAFIFYGIFRIYMGIKLKSWHNRIDNVKDRIDNVKETYEI
ncbi:MAG: HdeD family acid-resistance protein [Candidatus Azobacteroides sp.]|nr:HdeD family acid-resistance protein [Candidatus Azobacteroides sp.]